LKLIGQYKYGKLFGELKEYYPNGSLFKVSKFKEDRLHGWCTTYSNDAEEITKFFYQYGERLTGKDLDNYLQLCEKKGIDPNQ
jgi:antitoxin component YwqK of YwqJK toxin-antitoxin module